MRVHLGSMYEHKENNFNADRVSKSGEDANSKNMYLGLVSIII
jgi:hypothetical protein